MPFVYTAGLNGTSVTTNGSANTETEDMFIKAGTGRAATIISMLIAGKAAGLTAISGITERLRKWTTASTSGTSVTPVARDPGAQAAKFTSSYSPTAGSGGGTYLLSIGCAAGGPGGWIAENADAGFLQESAAASSIDAVSMAGTVSLVHDVNIAVQE